MNNNNTKQQQVKKTNNNKRNYQKVVSKNQKKQVNDSKKVYKIMIRDLPFNDFNQQKFQEYLLKFLDMIHISEDNVEFLHFIEGKLSRKRGPLPGVGFICARDEISFVTIIKAFLPSADSSPVLFLPDENADSQPQICIASYQKRFRGKGRMDKLANTIESDRDFIKFQEELKQPVEKLPSAELQLEAKEKLLTIAKEAKEAFIKKETAKLKALASKRERGRGISSKTERAIRLAVAANLANKESAEAIKKNPLLQFMKEKAEKKTVERKLLLKDQAKKKASTKGSSSKDKDKLSDETSKHTQSKAKGRDKDKEKTKEKGKAKDKAGRAKEEPRTNAPITIAKKPVTMLLKKREPEPNDEKEEKTTSEVSKASKGKQKGASKKDSAATQGQPPNSKKDNVTTEPAKGKGKEKGKNKGKKVQQTSIDDSKSEEKAELVSREIAKPTVREGKKAINEKKGVNSIKSDVPIEGGKGKNKNKGNNTKQDSRQSNNNEVVDKKSRPPRTEQSTIAGIRNAAAGGGHHNIDMAPHEINPQMNYYAPQYPHAQSHYAEPAYQQQPLQQDYFHHGQGGNFIPQYQVDYQHHQTMNASYLPPPPPPQFSSTQYATSTQPNPKAPAFRPQSSNRR